ncbi:MAG: SDR family oxidoreductase [Candidatus Hydrogenedentes bacterium]|nr:SDR family oxidoreductase [Candidatus Hydrogenedentota bacterium]
MDIKNRSVFITGASMGIGLAIAREMASRGANVFLVALDGPELPQAKESIARDFPAVKVQAAPCDVRDFAGLTQAAEQMHREFGGIDGVVCNAGLDCPGYFADKDPEEFRRLMEVNYLGTVFAAKAVLPYLKPGSFISFTSSMAGVMGIFGYSSYCPTKFAQIGLAECLRQEMWPRGVQISVLCPPDTDTPGLRDETKVLPRETQIITGAAKLMKAEDVARGFVTQLLKGKFLIRVNFESHLIYRAKGIVPSLLLGYLRRAIGKAPAERTT